MELGPTSDLKLAQEMSIVQNYISRQLISSINVVHLTPSPTPEIIHLEHGHNMGAKCWIICCSQWSFYLKSAEEIEIMR